MSAYLGYGMLDFHGVTTNKHRKILLRVLHWGEVDLVGIVYRSHSMLLTFCVFDFSYGSASVPKYQHFMFGLLMATDHQANRHDDIEVSLTTQQYIPCIDDAASGLQDSNAT